MDETGGYLSRGQAFASMSTDEVRGRWVVAFKDRAATSMKATSREIWTIGAPNCGFAASNHPLRLWPPNSPVYEKP